MSTRPSPYRLDNQLSELHQSAANLTRYVCIVSSRHIKDGVLRGRFNRTMAYYVRQVLADVRNGKIRADEGLAQIEVEHKGLTQVETTEALIGLRAGIYQFADGASICRSVATCVYGLPAAIHGANNVYENGSNLWTGKADAVGPVRKLYRSAAESLGRKAIEGDIAYGSVDIFLSGYALLRKIPKKGSWKLFRRMPADLERAYKQMGKGALIGDVSATGLTINKLREELEE